MSCKICLDGVSKYKCPSCRIQYCSVSCWKTHKSNGCGESGTATAVPSMTDLKPDVLRPTCAFPTDDTVPPEKLKLLDESDELRNILSNPHVQKILLSVDQATNPSKILHDAMQEPIFVEFVDECLKIIDPPSQRELEECMIEKSDAVIF